LVRFLGRLLTLALLGSAVALSAGEKAQAQKLVPLQLKLPEPIPLSDSNAPSRKVSKLTELAPPRGETPFMVPEGLKNVSLNRTVTSSDTEPIIGELKQITDGDKKDENESLVELNGGKVWVQIDLVESHQIYAIVMWHSFKIPRVYYDVVVQVSDDATFSKNVTTLFDNSAGPGKDLLYLESHEGKLVDGKDVKARFVRCYSNGNTSNEQNHYLEVEVWGRPVASRLSELEF
jgi:hypothetical protein